MKITLCKDGNLLRVRPCPPDVAELLGPALTYERRVFEFGGRRAGEGSGQRVYSVPTACFKMQRVRTSDGGVQPALLTTYGFRHVVQPLLKAAGHQLFFKNLTPHPRPEVYEPHWHRIEGVELLWRQREVLEKMVSNEGGRIDCFPGFGKTFLIHLLARVLYKARIDVVTRSATLARGIHKELAGLLPSVGGRGGGLNIRDQRVMVYVAKSHHHAKFDADIVIVDEGHEMALPEFQRNLMRYRNARFFMLSASQDMRLDEADFEFNGLFGPVLIRVGYQEGQAKQMVVPIQVRWREVFMDVNPCEHHTGVPKQRNGIWRNDYRNGLIVEDARSYGDDEQVLIVVSRIDHAMQLKYDLPEFTLVYAANGLATADREKFVRWRFITEDEPTMTLNRALLLKEQFEAGTLKKVIATSVWNRGVNFRHLAVLIRADASGSPIDDVQLPGRVSRVALPGQVKPMGIVHDYMDQFDKGFRAKARTREKSYKAQGWEQIFPQAKSQFRQQMLDGMT